MMSGKADLTDAVQATKLGAFHFLEKPLTPEGVLLALALGARAARARRETARLREALGHRRPMIGASRALDEVRELIARSRADRRARADHAASRARARSSSPRRSTRRARARDRPFVRVNCAAIPRDLVESEMFGHERGAFTGATERRIGRFELAHTGTLFLDEVGDLGPEAQAKLLRAIESREVIERLGGEKAVSASMSG